MFSPVIYLMLHSLFFTLRLSGGGGSFPRPLKPEEEKLYLERCAAGRSGGPECSGGAQPAAGGPYCEEVLRPDRETRMT